MKTSLQQIGNSRGVIIPKPLLMQLGLEDEVEMSVERDTIVLRRPEERVRSGWAQASRALHDAGEDKLVLPEFANAGDDALEW